MIRDTILLFTSIKEPVNALSDEDAGKLLKAILAYQTGEQVTLEGLMNVVFLQVKQQIDYNNEKYLSTTQKRSEAGKKGMAARWSKDNKNNNVIGVISTGNKNNLNENVNDNENVLTNECIIAHMRGTKDSDDENPDEDWDLRHQEDCISDDDVITTTDGRTIKLKDLKFPENIKVGVTRR